MKGLGHYCVELLDRLSKLPGGPLLIAETGTMFKTDFEPGETDLRARSTFAIAEWCATKGRGTLFSIDKDYEHLSTSHATLYQHKLSHYVTYVQGSGFESLCKLHMGAWDFVLLDSDSNADIILGEYNAVKDRMGANSIVLIDDAFKHPSVNKFARVREQLQVDRPKSLMAWYPIGGIAAAIPFGPAAGLICSEVYCANRF